MKKKVLLMIVLALGLCGNKSLAQEEVKKEYYVEDDGFEWYSLYLYEDGKSKVGAEDRYGNTIVPLMFDGCHYFGGFFGVSIKKNGEERSGVIDPQGYLIVPVEYSSCIPHTGESYRVAPYILVKKDGYEGVYDTYGRCLIPVNRHYKRIIQRSVDVDKTDKKSVYYECKHGKWDEVAKFSICDASGKCVFTTKNMYKDIWVSRNKVTWKYYVWVEEESGHNYYIDRNENVVLDLHGQSRNLTQAEKNKVSCFPADWLSGNSEYFAHAVEWPKHKIAQGGGRSGLQDAGVTEDRQQQQGGGTTPIVVEHHRDPIPVQQWQACIACGGMGTMGCDNCGGSGTKYIGDRLQRCSRCNGQGLIPCRTCFGNKGQYITVYQ